LNPIFFSISIEYFPGAKTLQFFILRRFKAQYKISQDFSPYAFPARQRTIKISLSVQKFAYQRWLRKQQQDEKQAMLGKNVARNLHIPQDTRQKPKTRGCHCRWSWKMKGQENWIANWSSGSLPLFWFPSSHRKLIIKFKYQSIYHKKKRKRQQRSLLKG